jgi:hypothetical protein
MAQRLAGIAWILGSLLFLMGAFSPIASRFFTEPDPQRRLKILEADLAAWTSTSVLFGVGAAVAAVGFVPFAWHIRRSQGAGVTSFASYLAAGAAGVSLVSAAFGYYRWAVSPPQEWVLDTTVPWTAYANVVLTQIALLITGVVLLRAGCPRWFGWTVLVATSLTVITLILVRNFPPLLFYFIMLFMGIAMAALPTADQAVPAVAASDLVPVEGWDPLTRICPSCGKKVAADRKSRCNHCGAPFVVRRASPPQEGRS